MKLAFVLPLMLLMPWLLQGQCSEIPLGTLQALQKAEPSAKEAKILDLGFDLASESGSGATNIRKYNKCWHTTTRGKAFYDQVILWHTNLNHITFLTLNESTFQNLKNAIDERHSTGGTSQVVIGKMFRYTFEKQSVDGFNYSAVTIALK